MCSWYVFALRLSILQQILSVFRNFHRNTYFYCYFSPNFAKGINNSKPMKVQAVTSIYISRSHSGKVISVGCFHSWPYHEAVLHKEQWQALVSKCLLSVVSTASDSYLGDSDSILGGVIYIFF